jgi:alpha-1,3/alpha-1,6-mannosyltransferase
LLTHFIGGYDPRVQDNVKTLQDLRRLCADLSLSYTIIADLTIDPPSPTHEFPDVQFILNFTTPQRTALLNSPSTRALLYTPTNEHFGIVPLEAMACGLPVLACKSGGPVETVENITLHTGTGWLKNEDPNEWAFILQDIMRLDEGTRAEIAKRCKKRVKAKFGMDVMSNGFQDVLREAVRIPHSTGLSWAQRFILLFVGITTFTFAVLMLIERFA